MININIYLLLYALTSNQLICNILVITWTMERIHQLSLSKGPRVQQAVQERSTNLIVVVIEDSNYI